MILGTAEGAVTIMAVSIPILRTLLKGQPSPPPMNSLGDIRLAHRSARISRRARYDLESPKPECDDKKERDTWKIDWPFKE
jgi:hypothetical protein